MSLFDEGGAVARIDAATRTGNRFRRADVLALRSAASAMALHLGQLCEHAYEHRYEGADRPCGGCYDAIDRWASLMLLPDAGIRPTDDVWSGDRTTPVLGSSREGTA